jgi:hypothetical protein
MQRGTISIVAAIVIVLLSLTVSFSYQWVTANTQGPITYSEKGEGLPFQYVIYEVASPVGTSSHFKVDPFFLVVDFLVWACVAYGALYALKLPRRKDHAVSGA